MLLASLEHGERMTQLHSRTALCLLYLGWVKPPLSRLLTRPFSPGYGLRG